MPSSIQWGQGRSFGRSSPKRPCPFPITPHPRTYQRLAAICADRSDLLAWNLAPRYRPALLALSAHRRDWIRPLEAWQPPDGDTGRQFASLARHLLARYDVPRFLDAAWLGGLTPEGATQQGWFKEVGAGRNLRHARGLPVPLTKRVAHHVLQTPADLGIRESFRFGEVVAQGGDEELARSLAATRLGIDYGEPDFWASVLRWFIAHPEVGSDEHGPIIDFLHHEKFVASVANPATRRRGQPRQPLLAPPQPHLSIKGRTPAALRYAMDGWHRRLHARPIQFHEWCSSGIVPLVVVASAGATRRVYETTELICTSELQAEGEAMHHCVASYWTQCRVGQVSIWSLTVEAAPSSAQRLLTLEVRSEPRQIVQVKGHCNRPPTHEELALLARWSAAGGPELSSWLQLRLDPS